MNEMRAWRICGMIPGETKVLEEKPVSVPLCPPQMLCGQVWSRTGASAVRGRQLNRLAEPWRGCEK
jgi:hypothetical protein